MRRCNLTQKRAPLVSVVMPLYNGERYLAEAIESILSQTFADFEFIIVDDGSTDGSAGIIRDYAARDSRVKVKQLARNSGEAAARNAGIALARGQFVAGMDSDDISLPDRLRAQASFLENNPEVGAVGVHSRVVFEDAQPSYIREPEQGHALIMLDSFVGVPFQGRRADDAPAPRPGGRRL